MQPVNNSVAGRLPVKTALLLLFCLGVYFLLAQHRWLLSHLFPLPYRPLIEKYSAASNLPPHLVAAVIRVESSFNPRALSPKGARGLMQVMPETGSYLAARMGYRSFQDDMLFEPETNLQIGCWYLRELLDEFNGNTVLALAAYNAGRGNVKKWIRDQKISINSKPSDLPFPETRRYVNKVLWQQEFYRYIYYPDQ